MLKELPVLQPAVSPVDFSQYESKFKALADKKRLHIMYELTQKGSVCVCDLCEVVGMPQSKLSYHLKILLDAGLILREQRGTWCYYELNHAEVNKLLSSELCCIFRRVENTTSDCCNMNGGVMGMSAVEKDEIRQFVRSRYKEIALLEDAGANCCSPEMGCCSTPVDFDEISAKLGYSSEELSAVPEGANLGLGCGNPQAIAALKPGEVVLDLGSGGGFDCFLAARQVGESGKVIGVDMTPEMISRARANAVKGGYANTEFRLGEIEHLPVPDNSVDVIISNCVINLSPDKQQVFDEAYRVLKPGGRLAISDIVTTAELPDGIKHSKEALAGCISGASSIEALTEMMSRSGFQNIRIEPKDESKSFIRDWIPGAKIEDYIVSAVIQAEK